MAEDEPDDDVAVFGGVDLTGGIRPGGFPIDLAWLVGAGLGVGDAVLVSVPLGISLGGTPTADGDEPGGVAP